MDADVILDTTVRFLIKGKCIWTPSKMIHRFGEVINNPESIWYWAAKVKFHIWILIWIYFG